MSENLKKHYLSKNSQYMTKNIPGIKILDKGI